MFMLMDYVHHRNNQSSFSSSYVFFNEVDRFNFSRKKAMLTAGNSLLNECLLFIINQQNTTIWSTIKCRITANFLKNSQRVDLHHLHTK